MKNLKKSSSFVIALIMLISVMLVPAGVAAEGEESIAVADMNQTVAVGDILVGAYGNDNYSIPDLDILAPYGLVRTEGKENFKTNNSALLFINAEPMSIIFRIYDNSPFWFDASIGGSAGINLYVSSDDDVYTRMSYSQVGNESDRGQYYVDSIGEGNEYVRLEFIAWNWEHVARLFSVKFNEGMNANIEALKKTLDMKETVVAAYGNDNYSIPNIDFLAPYGLIRTEKADSDTFKTNNNGLFFFDGSQELIFRVEDNSSFWFDAQIVGSGAVKLYISPDDVTYTEIKYVQIGSENGRSQYYVDRIGKGNKYVKFEGIGAGNWNDFVRLFKVKLNPGYDEAIAAMDQTVPVADVVVGAYGNDNYSIPDLDVLKPYGLLRTESKENFKTNNSALLFINAEPMSIIFRVADNSSFWFDAQIVGSGAVKLYVSPDDVTYTEIKYVQIGSENGRGQYYVDRIGKGNKYVKFEAIGPDWNNLVHLFNLKFERNYDANDDGEVNICDLISIKKSIAYNDGKYFSEVLVILRKMLLGLN